MSDYPYLKFDLDELPPGRTYEHEYNGWLGIFQDIAETDGPVIVSRAPHSWVTLLHYLGADVHDYKCHFPEDLLLVATPLSKLIDHATQVGRMRELVEFHSALRPELVDALYKSDVEWKSRRRRHQMQGKFNVTCNGSFFRPEVVKYVRDVTETYRPVHLHNCVLVPCAADKPYPAPLHRKVDEVLRKKGVRDKYEVIVATGVLGLVPEDLWPSMPVYDSGLPNEWRLMQVCSAYFAVHGYDRIVVYSDFYANAILAGLERAGTDAIIEWPLRRVYKGYGYLNLQSTDNLALLADVV